MRDAIVYDPDEIKAILAERHGVTPKEVIKSQFSYVVMLESKKEEKDNE